MVLVAANPASSLWLAFASYLHHGRTLAANMKSKEGEHHGAEELVADNPNRLLPQSQQACVELTDRESPAGEVGTCDQIAVTINVTQ